MGCLQPADDIPRLPSGLEHQAQTNRNLGRSRTRRTRPNGNASKGLTAELSNRMSWWRLGARWDAFRPVKEAFVSAMDQSEIFLPEAANRIVEEFWKAYSSLRAS